MVECNGGCGRPSGNGPADKRTVAGHTAVATLLPAIYRTKVPELAFVFADSMLYEELSQRPLSPK
jgi:hypothetical protein